ncbi:hypothetical protein AVEN_228954-1 [Araneus ventricosus]|uniref:Uncharacterized protein n=1 Tax=Araneus ventricosus TaxID=182803 RepID=A0A4Y2K789_ARAVE|nr:hypothetical protein AVEN_228954-1 [Araneus ventricosus]
MHKLTAQTDNKSLSIIEKVLLVMLSVYQLTGSDCGQNSKEIQRRSVALATQGIYSLAVTSQRNLDLHSYERYDIISCLSSSHLCNIFGIHSLRVPRDLPCILS